MASFTIGPDSRFHVGDTIYCYRQGGGLVPVSVTPTTMSTVQANSTVTFTGLAFDTGYLAGLAITGPFVQFNTDAAPGSFGATFVLVSGPVTDETYEDAAGVEVFDGADAFDTVNLRRYVRSGGVWTFTQATYTATSISYPSPTAGSIVFEFETPVQAGQYVNGDWWVCALDDPVVITAITPDMAVLSTDGGPVANGLNGVMVNPTAATDTVPHSWDGRAALWEAPTFTLPYTPLPGESVVKVISADPLPENYQTFLRFGAVLTVLGDPPSLGMFRPPFVGTLKDEFLASAIRMDLLEDLESPASKITDAVALARTAHLRMNYHPGSVHGYYLASAEAHGDPAKYGRTWGGDALKMDVEVLEWLHCDGASFADKRSVAIGVIQNGIDLYGSCRAGHGGGAGMFRGGGANGANVLNIMAFAAAMLQDEGMLDFLARESESWTIGRFWETSFFYIASSEISLGHTLWGASDPFNPTEAVFWDELNKPSGTGIFNGTARDPYEIMDGGSIPGQAYQITVSHQCQGISALMDVMPSLRAAWPDYLDNAEAFYRYGHRWATHGIRTQPDDAQPKSASESNYGVTYGPDGADYFKDAAYDGGTTPSGRWPEIDGTEAGEDIQPVDGNRYSQFTQDFWDANGVRPYDGVVPVLVDDFSGTGDLDGAVWATDVSGVDPPTLHLMGDGLGQADSDPSECYTVDLWPADGQYEFVVDATGEDDTPVHTVQLCLRVTDLGVTRNEIVCGYGYNGATFVWQIVDIIDGAFSAGSEAASPVLPEGTKLVVRAEGSTITLYRQLGLAGYVEPLVVHETAISGTGKIGMKCNSNSFRMVDLRSSVESL